MMKTRERICGASVPSGLGGKGISACLCRATFCIPLSRAKKLHSTAEQISSETIVCSAPSLFSLNRLRLSSASRMGHELFSGNRFNAAWLLCFLYSLAIWSDTNEEVSADEFCLPDMIRLPVGCFIYYIRRDGWCNRRRGIPTGGSPRYAGL